MRDTNRIDKILEQIGVLWHKNPDLRLGQLITFLIGDEPFFVEDDELIVSLKKRNIENVKTWKCLEANMPLHTFHIEPNSTKGYLDKNISEKILFTIVGECNDEEYISINVEQAKEIVEHLQDVIRYIESDVSNEN